ncbi:MAG: hypothetical protein V1926_03870 [Candidatus Peregrinibacteria bacterium]
MLRRKNIFFGIAIFLIVCVAVIALRANVLGGHDLRKTGEAAEGAGEIRDLTAEDLDAQIRVSLLYVRGMIDPDMHGVHKYYDPVYDTLEPRVHTIYTASTAYTFLQEYRRTRESVLLADAIQLGEFLLSMQQKEKGAAYGAFEYSRSLESQKGDSRYVVGTTSKTIFTLLELSALTGESEYLDAARLAGDWLITMQQEDGGMKPVLHDDRGDHDAEDWEYFEKESTLYNGQVLSALSRLSVHTKDDRYLKPAQKLASFLMTKVNEEGCYVGDDYRTPNPVSSSWIIMAFLDYTGASGDTVYEEQLFACSETLVAKQYHDVRQPERYGRWHDSFSTSGTGWISEVMTAVAKRCYERRRSHCDAYTQAANRGLVWVFRYAVTDERSRTYPHPQRSLGGVLWSEQQPVVRTDAVCHALNAAIFLQDL